MARFTFDNIDPDAEQIDMIQRPHLSVRDQKSHSFADLMRRLGDTFAVRDVMVPLSRVEYVSTVDGEAASRLVEEKRYSVVPISNDGAKFDRVYVTSHSEDGSRIMTEHRDTSISDYIPDSTPLAEALFLFEDREWYFTLRGIRVSGLLTYWGLNSREFRLQMYAALSRIEELSRDALAKDECGTSSDAGLKLTPDVLQRVRSQFEKARCRMGGHRFVDELQFHQVNDALRKHCPWREHLRQRLGSSLSNKEYDRRYNFTDLRDRVMHGRILFPTYQDFKEFTASVDNLGEFITHLDAYIERASPAQVDSI